MEKKDIILMVILLLLTISPIDIMPGNILDDIGYIIGFLCEGKKMLGSGN